MVALKAFEIDRFVTTPDPKRPVVLVFGPDAGLVRERVDALIGAAVDDPRDPFTFARLDGDTLADAPERLIEEAHTVALFGGRRAVWVKAGGRNFVTAVERLLAAPPGPDCRVIIEAGDLRRGTGLRAICERSPITAALPCYVDSGRDLERLIETEMRNAQLTITADARALLASLIGSDRAASRAEIRKLALYAHGKKRVDADDVMAVVADASATMLDAVIDAAFAGSPRELEIGFAKARASGIAATAMASSIVRHAGQLHRLSLAVGAGASIGEVVESAAIHFSRKALVNTALARWNANRLERLLVQLGDAALEARQRPELADAIVHRALLSIAVAARRRDD
jgi:DNA polymerase III subunit delta